MISREILKQIILDQRARQSDSHVLREALPRVQEWLENKQIIIVTGLRRCGKSTFMKQIRELLKEVDFCINFEDERLIGFTVQDFQALLEVFIELFGAQKTIYFDEIQNIEDWERFVRRLHDEGYKIYITGSNAHLLSKELGTHLTGRYLSLEMYPYSFREYNIDCNHEASDSTLFDTTQRALHKKWFNEYLTQGGLPEYLQNKDTHYLIMLYENILYRDIISRYNIPHEKPLKELALYLANNIGKSLSYNSLRKMLGLASGTTVAQYCQYLENSYLFFFINRYDDSLKRQMLAPKKSYIIDNAMAQVLGFRTSHDAGRFLENTVFLELKRRDVGEIYYHQGAKECDFILRKGRNITQAIQVCLHLNDQETAEREYAGLLEAMQAYGLDSGLILVEDENRTESITVEGKKFQITIQPVWEWMTMKPNN
jgi:predicted AAA+ superfamily ATPase